MFLDIVQEYVQIWKSPCTYFAGTCQSRDHDVMDEKYFFLKPTKFGVNEKINLCWSILTIEPIAGFCPFVGYWPWKNASRDYGIKCEFVSLAIRIVLSTIRNKMLCWSAFALRVYSWFASILVIWSLKGWDQDVKRNLLLMQNL